MNPIKMASNENPYGPSPRAVAAMRAVLAECNLYPDNDATELQAKLAKLHQVQSEQVVVAAGLTALLETISRDARIAWIECRHQRAFVHRLPHCYAGGGRAVDRGPDA